jgi:hypothetical protein
MIVGACQKSSRSVPPPPRGPLAAGSVLDADGVPSELDGVPSLPVEPDVAAAVEPDEVSVELDDGVSSSDELPQAAKRAAIAGALSPSATARLSTARRLSVPRVAALINSSNRLLESTGSPPNVHRSQVEFGLFPAAGDHFSSAGVRVLPVASRVLNGASPAPARRLNPLLSIAPTRSKRLA